ncbi:hypothetical protein L218DRAFT_1064329, partial [Marasmius fiardii PR-910]
VSPGSFPTGQGHVPPADLVPPPPPVNPDDDPNAMQNVDDAMSLPYLPPSFVIPSYVPTQDNPPIPPVQWNDLASLFHTVVEMGNTLREISKSEDAACMTLSATYQGMLNISHQFQNMQTQPPAPKSPPKFKEAEFFNGKAMRVEPFIKEMEDAIFLLGATLPTDRHKCIYFTMYLGAGTPKDWQ